MPSTKRPSADACDCSADLEARRDADVPPLALIVKVSLLAACKGRKRDHAARLLQVGVRTICGKLRGYGIPVRLQNTQAEPERIAPDPDELQRVVRFLLAAAPPATERPDEFELQELRRTVAWQSKLLDQLRGEQAHPTRLTPPPLDPRTSETTYDRRQRSRETFATQ